MQAYKNIQDFNNGLISILPEYKKNIKIFTALKIFNYYFYFLNFIAFCIFFFTFFVFDIQVSNEETFNNYLYLLGSSFFVSIFLSAISFAQQGRIYKKLSINKNPIFIYTLLHTIVFFLFLSTLTSAAFSLFLTYLSFQMPYFIFVFKLEKLVENYPKSYEKN